MRRRGAAAYIDNSVMSLRVPKDNTTIVYTNYKENGIITDVTKVKATVRRHLDNKLAQMPAATAFAKPPAGWIRAIRQALGMSAADLGARMGVSKARVLAIEKSEAVGALKLDTLQRAAEALNCAFVYALIPRKPLEQAVRDQALTVAAQHLSAVDHTMRLEDQAVSAQAADQQLKEVAEDLMERSPRSLWKRRATH